MYKKNNKVFYFSLIVVIAMAAWGILNPTSLGSEAGKAFSFLVNRFGWFYLVSVFIFLIFCIYLAFSKYSGIKLGPDDSVPEYSFISWFAMLFSAGMAIGLIFWGVAEPLNHYLYPPHGLAASGSKEAATLAFRYSFFHWGLHAWANYALLAMALAYFQLRKGKPGLISSIFIPLIGEERVRGPIGYSIDILAIFATVAGVATDLGLGTLQINSGLNYLFGIPENRLIQIIIITVVTILFMISAIRGIDRGIKALSDINLLLTIVLMGLVIFIGPTRDIFNNLFKGLGSYAKGFISDSIPINAFKGGNEWLGNWTIFYWAWWIAWTPFVGTFIARISKGRTIREFIIGVLLVPSLGSFLWFSIFGTVGINAGYGIATEAIKSIPTAFFVVIETYPMGFIISIVTIILLCTFFITSADSSTFVLGMMSSNGDLNPTTRRKIVWGIIQSLLALALLLAGGLEVLQTASIVAAFPFAFIMLFTIVSLYKSLREEVTVDKKKKDNLDNSNLVNDNNLLKGSCIEFEKEIL